MKQISNPGPGAWATALLMGSVAAASVCVVEPAQAYTWDAESVTFSMSDVDATVDVFYFDGFIEEELIEGLTSSLKLTLTDFDGLSATLKGEVTNTMDTGVLKTGRVTGIAFNVDPDVKTASSTGVFTQANLDKTFPGGIGTVDVCYGTNKNSCGGNQGGVSIGQTGTFYTTLTWSSLIDTFTLSDFVARYQGMDFAATNSIEDESGIGIGTVPTPALIPSLLGLAMAARRHKKQQEAEQQEAEAVTLTA